MDCRSVISRGLDARTEDVPAFIRSFSGDHRYIVDYLVERSPATYLDNIACPILMLQGRNDPRVIEQESRQVVKHLRRAGKEVEYKVFESEGHDVLKHENKVTCYSLITEFFKKHLRP